jgi:uncharacterized secreted protein with C-terminal beta-propeller domain
MSIQNIFTKKMQKERNSKNSWVHFGSMLSQISILATLNHRLHIISYNSRLELEKKLMKAWENSRREKEPSFNGTTQIPIINFVIFRYI